MNVNIADITITSLETITAFDVVTGGFLFTLDELQSATITQAQDKNDITGKQGRKLNSIKRNKTVTISGDNGLVSAGLLSLQTGGKFENKETIVMWCDYLTVKEKKAKLNYKAVGAEDAQISNLYIKNADGTLGDAYTQDSAADYASKKFKYDSSTQEIDFGEADDLNGKEIVVWYNRQITASVMSNYSDTYSEKCTLYVDAIGEDTCGNQYHVQFYIPKADFDGNFDFSMGDNQTVHSFEAEALAGACGTSGKYFDFTIFGADEDSDAAVGP